METLTTHRIAGEPIPADDEPILEIQFDDLEQQHEASMLGMWLFLATEVMFFGGLIAAYAVYRTTAPEESIGRWERDLPPDVREACHGALGEALQAFGYPA